jgi:hypothetical protein
MQHVASRGMGPTRGVRGECASNPTLMNKMCPPACGICSELEEVFYRKALGGDKEKDEI